MNEEMLLNGAPHAWDHSMKVTVFTDSHDRRFIALNDRKVCRPITEEDLNELRRRFQSMEGPPYIRELVFTGGPTAMLGYTLQVDTSLMRHCPNCGMTTLRFIETCESDDNTVKTSWTCDCTNMVVYIYEFKDDRHGKRKSA